MTLTVLILVVLGVVASADDQSANSDQELSETKGRRYHQNYNQHESYPKQSSYGYGHQQQQGHKQHKEHGTQQSYGHGINPYKSNYLNLKMSLKNQ
jgi:hypothetical protein